MLKVSILNKIFILELIFFGFIITGLLPRETSIFLVLGLVIYIAIASIEDATIFFIRSIPLFIAIPITANYDNLNTWRILSIIIFLKWFLGGSIIYYVLRIKKWIKNYSIKKPSVLLLIMLLLAILSIIPAADKGEAIKRIIYFINLSLIGIVIYELAGKNAEFIRRLIKNIAIPTIIVTIIGFIQLASTYFIDIYQFMRIWGEGIQTRQFGVLWSEIAVRLGNTWFAYYGDQLSLRVFSLFPDSHSFPQFVLLGLPAIFAISFQKLTTYNLQLTTMIRTRANMSVLWIPTAFLIAILSGTRGIWVASAGVLIIIAGIIYWMHRTRENNHYKNIFKYISLYMLVFFMLFVVAYPIFVSPQFLLSKGNWELFGERIKSIIDFGETSNSQRVEIWKASLESIKERPLLGVGIGNFPVVLDQRIFLARAGSSAHNIYLHIAAETGIPALIITVWFLWLGFKKSYDNFIFEKDSLLITYFGATILFVPWVLIYSLTDVALFDERTFLLFVATTALIWGIKNPDKIGGKNSYDVYSGRQ